MLMTWVANWGLATSGGMGPYHGSMSAHVCQHVACSALNNPLEADVPGLGMWLQRLRDTSPQFKVPMLLDFAGSEAPLWALKELGVPVRHVASSDIASGPQKFILRNFKPEHFFPDVLKRTHAELAGLPVGTRCPNACLSLSGMWHGKIWSWRSHRLRQCTTAMLLIQPHAYSYLDHALRYVCWRLSLQSVQLLGGLQDPAAG